MVDELIVEAISFARCLRFQLCKKQKQVLSRNLYSQKIWGSQIKGGLEVCDAILLENQNLTFISSDDLKMRYRNIIFQLKKEFIDLNKEYSFLEYADQKTLITFGKANKAKVNALTFEKEVNCSVLRGSLKTCEKLLFKNDQELIQNIDVMLGDVHIERMDLWNSYAATSKTMKKIDLMDAMIPNPDRNKLIHRRPVILRSQNLGGVHA